MARHAKPREDLLRDARALVPRVQFRLPPGSGPQHVFAGFRHDALSLYFDDDPAFHFNSQGQLRRALVADRLIKAERGRLIAMERQHGEKAVVLRSTPLASQAQRELLEDVQRRLAELKSALEAGRLVLVGQQPPEGDAAARLAAWLARVGAIDPAQSPRLG
ncbi:MAG TPA: hypothetical protein PKC18_09320 [Lacipirellulaceae bacterium]|nr:hypothetical protein [Lacipirellulaceae bacterium]